jgi:hypothetical protein
LGGDINSQDPAHWNYFWDPDFNLDGKVDQTDLDQLLANFGKKGQIND